MCRPRQHPRWICLLPLLDLLTACAALSSPQERHQQANALAAAHQWHETTLVTPPFRLKSYGPPPHPPAEILSVYIEGDGLAWLTPTLPSTDPTPRHPLALQLALAQAEGRAAYLARPCQYQEGKREDNGEGRQDANLDAKQEMPFPPCSQRYWTGSRFAPEVIDAMDNAVSQLMQRHGASALVLVGYSGGGSVAALLAMRRTDVIRLVTVAGNLDTRPGRSTIVSPPSPHRSIRRTKPSASPPGFPASPKPTGSAARTASFPRPWPGAGPQPSSAPTAGNWRSFRKPPMATAG